MSQTPYSDAYYEVTVETTVNPLDLRRNVVLERFEFTVATTDLSLVHEWVYRTLQTVISPPFNEFVIWLLGSEVPWTPMNGDGWKVVDALLIALAKRNPGFRIVFRWHGDESFITSYLPLVRSKGLVLLIQCREPVSEVGCRVNTWIVTHKGRNRKTLRDPV